MNLTPTKRQIIRGPSGITVVPCCPACPRAGEAGAALLGDGSILLVYARFHGGGEDHAHADLFGGHLDPVSGRLVDTRVFHSSPEALNQMSVSLERLHDGSLGMLFLRKFAPTRDVVCFSRSGDDGRNWSEPLVINAVVPDKYLTVNSDRLRQFSSGRLAVPAALYPEGDLTRPSSLALLYSDDLGASWAVSECVRISIQDVAEPHWILPEDAAVWKEARQSPLLGQEPGGGGIGRRPDAAVLSHPRRAHVPGLFRRWRGTLVAVPARPRHNLFVLPPVNPPHPRRPPSALRLQRPQRRALRLPLRQLGLEDTLDPRRQRRPRSHLADAWRCRGRVPQLLLHQHALRRRQTTDDLLRVGEHPCRRRPAETA